MKIFKCSTAVFLLFHSSFLCFLPQAMGLGHIEFEWLHPSTTVSTSDRLTNHSVLKCAVQTVKDRL